jgi:hypothetical protein
MLAKGLISWEEILLLLDLMEMVFTKIVRMASRTISKMSAGTRPYRIAKVFVDSWEPVLVAT